MCTFIFPVAPTTAPETELRHVMEEFALGDRPCDDVSMTGNLAMSERAFYAESGWCGCGTLLGRGETNASRETEESAQLVADGAKKRKAGWSETRITRWRQEREAAVDKRKQEAEIQGHGVSEIARLMNCVRAVLERGIAPRVGLYYRTFRIKKEDYLPVARRTVKLADMSPDDFLRMPENVLTQFAM